jgi:spore coat polysaccharide biosynthesis protein SpsF
VTEAVWIVVSARMASSRSPGKALADLGGRPLLEVLLERMRTVQGVSGVALATSVRPENDALAAVAARLAVPVFRGDEDDVLLRHLDCARWLEAEHVVRVTGDNPLTDVGTAEALVARHLDAGADYTYVPGDALLMGILSEVISAHALARAWERGEARHRSELMTLYIKEHPAEFRIALGALPAELYRPRYRLTVDEPEDLALMQALFSRLARPGHVVTTREAIALMDADPTLAAMNAAAQHKAANLHSVALDASIVGSNPR